MALWAYQNSNAKTDICGSPSTSQRMSTETLRDIQQVFLIDEKIDTSLSSFLNRVFRQKDAEVEVVSVLEPEKTTK